MSRLRPAALISTVLVVICAGLAGGQAQAASPAPNLPSCVDVTKPSVQIFPSVIGQAQLPATFTTTDPYFAGRGGYFDAITLDCAKLSVTPVLEGESRYVSFIGAASLSCGQHVFDDKYYAGGTVPDQETFGTFTVSCITANPDIIIGTRQPVPITLTGSVFPQDFNSFTVDIDGTPLTTSPTFNGDAFTTVITASGLACGKHTITVNDKMGGSPPVIATAPLTVVQCSQPTLTANPAVFVDGSYTHVTGAGFAPGQPVALTWQTVAGATLSVCSPTADSAPSLVADATGNLDTFCYAPPHQILGAAQIVATQTTTVGAVQSVQHAAAPVVIEGGSMQPSSSENEFIFRH